MMRTMRIWVGLLSGVLSWLAAPSAQSEPPPKKAPAAPAAAPLRADVGGKVRRGVAMIERDGKRLALGLVLGNDGRILTALQPVGEVQEVDVRYVDGSVVRARVAHRDAAWNVALVVPSKGRWADGLLAAESAPAAGTRLTAFTSGAGRALPAAVTVKGVKALAGTTDADARNVLELTTTLGPKDLGSPVVDDAGAVVALVTRGCLPREKGECVPVPVGVPVDALRAFLRGTPPQAMMPVPWLGAYVVPDAAGVARGVRVRVVEGDGPADEAGLRALPERDKADLIVAADGTPVTTAEGLSQAIRAHAVGDCIRLLVLSEGKYKQVRAVLRAAPVPAVDSASAASPPPSP